MRCRPTSPTKWYERKSLRQIFVDAACKATILDIASNSPAARAGLQTDDEVIALERPKDLQPGQRGLCAAGNE